MTKIRKVVFPVGGLGTRFLPATKSMPKEMLPVVDKPLIQYAYEEAVNAGIEQFIFVTGRNKSAIENHFDLTSELQAVVGGKRKTDIIAMTTDWLPKPGTMTYLRQQQPLGLGHAVWCARHAVGNEPFAVILADDLVHSKKPCLKQMIEAYKEGTNMAAVMDVPREKTASYGILKISEGGLTPPSPSATPAASGSRSYGATQDKLVQAHGLVEKPKPEDAPSTLSIIGRYILQPEIFGVLENQAKGAGGEIQLTDALNSMIGSTDFYGYRFDGIRYDCGEVAGYIEANVALALARPDLSDSVRERLTRLMA